MPTLDNDTVHEPAWWECLDGNVHDLVCFSAEDEACEYCGMPVQHYWDGYMQEVIGGNESDTDDEEGTRSKTPSTGPFAPLHLGEGEDGGSDKRPERAYIQLGME